jgi:hypothetical protein
MESIINHHLDKLQRSIDWINASLKGEKRKLAYRKLTDCRRKIKRIKKAMADNPAAAMYGESQVGKSYLVSGLLSTPGSRFNVVSPEGRNFDFINDINPIGGEKESTGLVTRFSLSHRGINDKYPVKIKLLSIVDIVLMLCDTYYTDVKGHDFIKMDELEKEVAIFQKTKADSREGQSIIMEDDILDIRDYFEMHFKSKAPHLESSDYFDKVSIAISGLGPDEWGAVFSLLWNRNRSITTIFSKLVQKYKEIDFVEEVHVSYDAVLREYGTLLDVARLNEINNTSSFVESNYKSDAAVYYVDRKGDHIEKKVSKSYLCAIAAELVFTLPENLKESKAFLEKTDLLDFPGARARMEIYESNIKAELIPQMLLRGKVAYLFNQYSSNYKINTLLFCHGKKQSAQRLMPEILNRWIVNFIGESPEARQAFITVSKLPPLFVIATMFNLDLKFDQSDKIGNTDALKNRWSQRFSTALQTEIFNSETYDWFHNWTIEKPFFQNIYLLRDFYYSSELQNQIYHGYNQEKREIAEIVPEQYPGFRSDLKASFINYDFVKKHFQSPEHAWDSAAAKNEDGTSLIIERLSLAVMNINAARKNKFIKELNQIKKEVASELEKHYHSKNSDILLMKAKETAGHIQFKLDARFEKTFLFGKLMQSFIIKEGDIFNLYRQKLRSIEMEENKNPEAHSVIKLSVPELSLTKDFNTNLEILRKAYEKPSAEICRQDFEKEGIDLNELFYGSKNRVRNFSKILAEDLETYWFEECLQKKLYNNHGDLLSESEITDIINMLQTLYRKLRITDRVAESIRKYVDRYDKIEEVQEMIADISAEIINKFINTVGFAYFSDEKIAEMRTANVNNNLGLQLDHDYLTHTTFSVEDVAGLFQKLDALPELIEPPRDHEVVKNMPWYGNYKKWRDLLKLGFISVCDIPNYDIDANERLGHIMKACNEIEYAG